MSVVYVIFMRCVLLQGRFIGCSTACIRVCYGFAFEILPCNRRHWVHTAALWELHRQSLEWCPRKAQSRLQHLVLQHQHRYVVYVLRARQWWRFEFRGRRQLPGANQPSNCNQVNQQPEK